MMFACSFVLKLGEKSSTNALLRQMRRRSVSLLSSSCSFSCRCYQHCSSSRAFNASRRVLLSNLKRNQSRRADEFHLTNRRYSSSSPSSPDIKTGSSTGINTPHRPPFPIRLALVGSAVTLGTPIFTIAGIFRLWTANRLLPEGVKKSIMFIIGGSTFTLFYSYIIPNIFEYSHIILPFALSNGVACVFWQAVGEATVGFETLVTLPFAAAQESFASLHGKGLLSKMLKSIATLPVGGAIIGSLSAITAPFLWPLAFEWCWAPDFREYILGGDDATWMLDAYFKVAIPVGIPVGFVSGLSLHHILKPVVLGTPGSSWTLFSLPALLCLSAMCFSVYRTLIPGGSVKSTEEYFWIMRHDPANDHPLSVNLASTEVQESHEQANRAHAKLGIVDAFHMLRRLRHRLVEWITWQKSSDENVKPKVPRYDRSTSFRLQEIGDAEVLYQLIDILVRHKHLELEELRKKQSSQDIRDARSSLDARAKSLLGLSNVVGALRAAEKLCILEKTSQSSDLQTQSDHSMVYEDILTKLLSHQPLDTTRPFSELDSSERLAFEVCQRCFPPQVRGTRAVMLLSQGGTELLEDELKDKLNYDIKGLESTEEEEEFYKSHRSEKRLEMLKKVGTYTAIALIPILPALAYFSRH